MFKDVKNKMVKNSNIKKKEPIPMATDTKETQKVEGKAPVKKVCPHCGVTKQYAANKAINCKECNIPLLPEGEGLKARQKYYKSKKQATTGQPSE